MISLVLITGPTASGKTALGIALARRLGGEVVNADSQQVYRGLDAGTAKPSAAERAEVPHHLYDVADPGAGFDAARYVALADAAIAAIAARGRLPIVCGGTGLYVRALLHGVADAPGRDPALRARLEDEAARLGRPALHARLAAIDEAAAAKIRPHDLVRVVRALEIAQGGRTQSELFARHGFREDRYRFRLLALDPPRAELHRRIEERAPDLLDGLVAEARRLPRPPPAKLPIGYADALEHVAGGLSRDEALRRLVVAHRRYARRQLVWLRKEPGVEWLATPVDADTLAGDLRAWRERAGRVL